MDHHTKTNRKPLVFISSVFIILMGSSFLAGKLKFEKVKQLDFISDITSDTAKVITPVAPSHSVLTSESAAPVKNYLTSNEIISYEKRADHSLAKFVTALKELKEGRRKKVRIAYFGDSMIEGDLITQDLRKWLQDYFGGNGVGFVPVTSVVARFRQTVGHTYSPNWEDNSFKKAASNDHLFLSGHYYLPNGNATVTYKATSLPHLSSFPQAFLLYGKTASGSFVQIDNKQVELSGSSSFNKTLVNVNCSALTLSASQHTPLFGFSFEDTVGVYIDNFSFRGISGMELQKLAPSMLESIQATHDYDLIVMQYGPNLLFKPNLNDFTWYKKPLIDIINKFQAGFPNASILVVSTADKSFKYKGVMETALGVEPLLQVQNEAAKEAGVNLYNLYYSMGGRNSMIKWVTGDTVLANKDYTHFNHAGAKKIGTMLFNAIMIEYERVQ